MQAVGKSIILCALLALFASAALFAPSAFAGQLAGEGTVAAPIAASSQPAKASIKQCSIRMVRSLAFTGSYLRPEPKVRYRGKLLVKGVDYRLSYKANRGIGQGAVIVEGKGKFTGSVKRKFEIKYSNAAIAFAACRLSYSRARTGGHKVNRANGYRGTTLYKKYSTMRDYNCARVVHMAIANYLRIDPKFPGSPSSERSYMSKSPEWKRVCRYKAGMENSANTVLRPGDVYSTGGHTCIYVGSKIPAIVYRDYLKAKAGKKRAKLGKRLADLGKPSKGAVWVSSHKNYMGGTAAHICSRADALAHTGGYIYRYVGSGSKDPNGATK